MRGKIFVKKSSCVFTLASLLLCRCDAEDVYVYNITPAQLHERDNRLSVIINKSDYEHKLTLKKKLNNLYKGHLLIPNNIDKFINLSDCNLTPQQKDFLNLGPNCHLRKILTDNTTILEHQNNKQKLQILEALHIRNMQPTLNRINYQTSANVLKCL